MSRFPAVSKLHPPQRVTEHSGWRDPYINYCTFMVVTYENILTIYFINVVVVEL